MSSVRKTATPCWFVILLLWALPAAAQIWRPMGPPGGDVRSLSADPADSRRVYLGTSDGHVFGSRDGGLHWQLLGRAGNRLDAVVAAIVVDARSPRNLYAATWTQDPAVGGGIFRSEDAGASWTPSGLAGHAVRALAQAPSHPEVLVAGALDGIFRTSDAGKTWERISPEGHEELRNLDSVAIDPHDPRTIYAGTFHLPWKTTDGGQQWFPIHTGMIDDSDVMSILVDGTNSSRVFASACSGIYRSDDAGGVWQKIQGIPYAARRTHVIEQDPMSPPTVYAATTEGLWKSANGGGTWRLVTPPDWVINALVLSRESRNHVVIGTDRLGVLVSEDGGEHFRDANEGFNHRQIVALAVDRGHSSRVLALLAGTRDPLQVTADDGKSWAPLAAGLRRQSLKGVYASPRGWWAALERGGFLRYDEGRRSWVPAGAAVGRAAVSPGRTVRAGRHAPAPAFRGRPLTDLVNDMAFSRKAWFAATARGLRVSGDQGATWAILPIGPVPSPPVRSVRASLDGKRILVATLRGLAFSQDAGASWAWRDLPLEAGEACGLDVVAAGTSEETFVVLAANGLYLSRDGGQHWHEAASGLPQAKTQDLAIAGTTLLASMQTGGLYISYDAGRNWTRIEGALADGVFTAVAASENAGTILAASATDGLYAVEVRQSVARAQPPGSN